MVVELAVQDDLQIVVPVRLARAATGGPLPGHPDVDDRGWRMNHPQGLNRSDARGAMFGMTVGATVTLRVVWEDIDATAPLFVTAEAGVAGPQFTVESPPGGGPIPASGEFRLRALADTTSPQKLQIRLGAADGPILYEAEPRVFSPLTLNIQPHICTIHAAAGPPGTGSTPQVNGAPIDLGRLARGVGAVWEPAGIRFNFAPARHHTLWGYVRDDFARWARGTAVGTEGHLVATHFVPNQCNVYFIRYMDNSLGVGVNRDTLGTEGWTRPGIIVGVEGNLDRAGNVVPRPSAGAHLYQELINDLAHEIGHFLTLQHVDNVNNPGRDDTFTRRCLMHPNNLLPRPGAGNTVRFDDCGYGTGGGGAGHRGCLITLKQLPNIATDSETVRARRRFRSPRLY